MVALVQKKDIAGGFGNEMQIMRVQYDFAVDGGLVADYDIMEANEYINKHW